MDQETNVTFIEHTPMKGGVDALEEELRKLRLTEKKARELRNKLAVQLSEAETKYKEIAKRKTKLSQRLEAIYDGMVLKSLTAVGLAQEKEPVKSASNGKP